MTASIIALAVIVILALLIVQFDGPWIRFGGQKAAGRLPGRVTTILTEYP